MILSNEKMIYVYELPERMSNGFCFGGGKPITFKNVDWFNSFDGITKEHIEASVKEKIYAVEGKRFLVCSPDNDISFTFYGTRPAHQALGGSNES